MLQLFSYYTLLVVPALLATLAVVSRGIGVAERYLDLRDRWRDGGRADQIPEQADGATPADQ